MTQVNKTEEGRGMTQTYMIDLEEGTEGITQTYMIDHEEGTEV